MSSRKRVRYSFDVHFVRIEEREAFLEKCKTVRQRLTPAGSPLLDNYSLFNILLDGFIDEATSPSSTAVVSTPRSMMRNSGKLRYVKFVLRICRCYVRHV